METHGRVESGIGLGGGDGVLGAGEWCRQPLAAHSMVINDGPSGSESGPGGKTSVAL